MWVRILMEELAAQEDPGCGGKSRANHRYLRLVFRDTPIRTEITQVAT